MSTYWNWPGSRWWSVDCHTHSPVSHDFGIQADRDVQAWERWIKAVHSAGIQAVAITDHNTAAGISKLQQAVASMEAAPVLFPGVEITASDGVHLLLLMDPACEQRNVEEFLSQIDIPSDKWGDKNARSPQSVEQILEKCGNQALIIGAHVNADAGLLQEHDGQQRIAVLQHQNLAAVEVAPNEEIDESWLDGSRFEIKRRLPQVWASDGHDFNELGRHFTWVKMTCPDIEGLRLALLDGAASLKPASRKEPGNPNVHAALALESITVRKGKFMGLRDPITVKFNPWLNTIIGGRGTGKSTLIDFCRKTLRREAELDSSDGSEEGSLRSLFDRRMRVPPSRREEGLLTDGTRIEIAYRKGSERFVLSWDQKGSVPPIARLDGDEQIPEEGDIRERFPVRIYSQKQLFALAQDPNALLAVIDDSVDGAGLKRQIKQMETRYLSLYAEARAASRQADGLPTLRASLAEVRRKLDILEGGGQAQVLNEYRKRRRQNETWRAILEAASQAVESVGDSAVELSVADFNIGAEDEDDPAQSLMLMHETLRQTVAHLESSVRGSIEQARRDIDKIDKGEAADRWRTAVEASENEFWRVSSLLAEEGISDPNEYGDLLEQAAEREQEIKALRKEQERTKELENEATKILAQYRGLRCELSNKRRSFAEKASDESIRVKINEYANCKNLAEELSEILGIERFEADRQELARRIQPQQAQSWKWEKLDGVVAEMRQFLSGDRDFPATKDQRFETALKKIPPERIDRLGLYLPEDAVKVSFKERGDWRPLTQGSPGQQTAALLAFVLGYGSEPIILDQPEDDLDNTLIYELLVSRLKETKTKRQVIVVTHNPNIVVHGDAELVLSLEAKGGQSHIACEGGLQERQVREEICRVMEGGREAFESRYQRIMPPQGLEP